MSLQQKLPTITHETARLGDTASPAVRGHRDYQVAIRDEALPLLRAKKNTLIEVVTAGGKTVIASDIVRHLSCDVLWIAHRIELVRQAKATLERTCQGEAV